MTYIPVHAGKRFEDMMVQAQERRDRRTENRQNYADVRRSRMTCSASLRSFTQTQDWTGGMAMSPSGRFRVVEEPVRKQKIFTKDGIRWDAACICLIVTALVLAVILLVDLSGIGISMRNIEKLNTKISQVSETNEQLQAQLDYSAGDVTVCTEAVRRNLISSGGARTIRLTAPTNANLTPASQAVEPEWNNGRASTTVNLLGD